MAAVVVVVFFSFCLFLLVVAAVILPLYLLAAKILNTFKRLKRKQHNSLFGKKAKQNTGTQVRCLETSAEKRRKKTPLGYFEIIWFSLSIVVCEGILRV